MAKSAPSFGHFLRRLRLNVRGLTVSRKFLGIAHFLASHFSRKRYGIPTRQGRMLPVAKEE
jgi:hypothetical protein